MSLTVKYYPDIVRICRSLTPINYEDLAQEVCIKALENKERLQDHNFIGWVFRVATNIHISKCRLYYNKNVTRGLDKILEIGIENASDDSFISRASNITDIEKLKDQIAKKCIDEDIDYKKELEMLIVEANLNDVEKLWIKAFLDKKLSYSIIEREIGINRFKASQRIKEIKKKLKDAAH